MKRNPRTSLVAWCSILVCLVAGCYPRNGALDSYERGKGYRFGNLDPGPNNSDDVFVVLAFSGGGTRAAALSYGVLEELKRTHIRINGQDRTLLDEVDVISSVSGGSFTAAYYALFRDRIFQDYERRFLNRNVTLGLVGAVLNPIRWPLLLSPNYSRIDAAAELYDRDIFCHKKFRDLADARTRPYLVMNATDMARGSRFEFTQEQFDLLRSDLSDVPVARGVAASSAFPFLLCPLTLDNHEELAGKNGYREPMWVDLAMDEWEVNPERTDRARRVRSYLSGGRKHIHLLDGGLADNIGLRGPWLSLRSTDTLDGAPADPDHITPDEAHYRAFNLLRMINDRRINTLVVIVVNARTGGGLDVDRSSHTPGLWDVALAVADGPMGNFSSDTVQLFQQEIDDLAARDAARARRGEKFHHVKYLTAEVCFDGIPDPERRDRCKGLKTDFQLDPADVRLLRESAHDVMAGSARFDAIRTFLADYHTPTHEPTADEIEQELRARGVIATTTRPAAP